MTDKHGVLLICGVVPPLMCCAVWMERQQNLEDAEGQIPQMGDKKLTQLPIILLTSMSLDVVGRRHQRKFTTRTSGVDDTRWKEAFLQDKEETAKQQNISTSSVGFFVRFICVAVGLLRKASRGI